MALSNMRNEPRREITESLVGIVPAAVFLLLDFLCASWVESSASFAHPAAAIVLFMVLGVIGCVFVGVMLSAAVLFTHALGETLCDALGRFDPRPRR